MEHQYNGWSLYQTAVFLDTITLLKTFVEDLKRRHPDTYLGHPKTKLFNRILQALRVEIPGNPNAPEYQQGNTLGPEYRHWRRAKLLNRFRLFFRFHSQSKIIVYAWLNDENTLRKAGSKSDPYAVFKRRLLQGNPPSDWDELMTDAVLI